MIATFNFIRQMLPAEKLKAQSVSPQNALIFKGGKQKDIVRLLINAGKRRKTDQRSKKNIFAGII